MDAKEHLLEILKQEHKLLKGEGIHYVRHDEHDVADLAKIEVRKSPNIFEIKIIDPGLIDFDGLIGRIRSEPLKREVEGKLAAAMAERARNFGASEYFPGAGKYFPIDFPERHVSAVLYKKTEYCGGEEDVLSWFRKGPYKWNHLGGVSSFIKPIREHAGLKGSIYVWETRHLRQFIDLVLGAGKYSPAAGKAEY